ncbi:MAG: hypothetical protein DCF24_08540 [Cyanobium sp.]|nr:MAG: hypothetical protein DCF24_08540 [Cyanobium sp.]
MANLGQVVPDHTKLYASASILRATSHERMPRCERQQDGEMCGPLCKFEFIDDKENWHYR